MINGLKYLDEDIILDVSGFQTSVQGVYQYRIYQQDQGGNISTIFIGNTFIKSGTGHKEIDITDLIADERYKCKDLFDVSLGANLIATYWVSITIGSSSYTSNEVKVCLRYRSQRLDPRMGCDFIDYEQYPAPADMVFHCLSGHIAKDEYILRPRIPFTNSDKFGLPLMLEKYADYAKHTMKIHSDGAVSSDGATFDMDTTVFDHQFLTLNQIFANASRYDTAENGIWMIDTLIETKYRIAEYDVCPENYYLCWEDRLGGFQVQPFGKTETYKENYSNNETVSYNYRRRLNSVYVQPNFEIQTGYLDENVYIAYQSIFTSPYLKLYDVKKDVIYDVINIGNTYTEKTYMNQNRQFFNMKLTLDIARRQNIIY